MKNFTCVCILAHCVAASAFALGVAPAMAQGADGATKCAPNLTTLQKRLNDKAHDGPDELRNFIYMRRAILQLDTHDVMIWSEQVDARHAACLEAAAAQALRVEARADSR